MSFLNRMKNMIDTFRPLNTLDSPPPTAEPPLKKQKTGSEQDRSIMAANGYSNSHFALSPELIDDAGSEHTARTDRAGSHGSMASIMSQTEGVIEFQNVQREGQARSNRRRRSHAGSQSPRTNAQKYGRSIEPGRDDIDNSDRDELAAEKSPHFPGGSKNPRRVNSTLHIADAADIEILGGPQKRLIDLLRPGKRLRGQVDAEEDELALETSITHNPRRAASKPTSKGSPQIAQRNNAHGSMKKERFMVRLRSALCTPNHRCIEDASGCCCFLGEGEASDTAAKGPELRAYTKEGDPVPEYEWVEITRRVNRVHYNPDSPYVKISQATVDKVGGKIGGNMVLQFSDSNEALKLVQWVKDNLGSQVQFNTDMERDKLCQTYETLMAAIKKAISGSPSPLEISRAARATAPSSPLSQATTQSSTALTRRPPRLVDQLRSSQQLPSEQYEQRSFDVTAPLQRSTRSRNEDAVMIDAPLVSSAPVSRWTEDHPEWSKNWRMPLVFHRTTVDKDDIPRLDEGQCLNDNLLGFGLHYLFEEYPNRHSELKKRVYVHNTFFYEKLTAAKSSREINYDGVKGWTSKVDLLSYDYIIVPVNEYYHWWVAIICNPGRLDPNDPGRSIERPDGDRDTTNSVTEGKSNNDAEKPEDVEMIDIDSIQSRDQRDSIKAEEARESTDRGENDSIKATRAGKSVVDLAADDTDSDIREKLNGITKPPKKDPSEETKILTLDSMGNSHYPAIKALKAYLLAEFLDKRQTKVKDLPKQIGMKVKNIPEQDNFSDCGIYLLGYIQQFVKDPDGFTRSLMQREKPGWKFDPSELREFWRNTIFQKQREHQAKQDEERRRKKEEAARRKAVSSTPTDKMTATTGSQTPGRDGTPHDLATDNGASSSQFAKPPVVSRNTNPTEPTPAPRPTTVFKSPSKRVASPAARPVTEPASVDVARGVSSNTSSHSPAPIPRPSSQPRKTADHVVVDLERDRPDSKGEAPRVLQDSPLPGEIRRPRSKGHDHSPGQRVSPLPGGWPEVSFMPKLSDSSPASDRRTSGFAETSGIAEEISPRAFYSNVPQRPQSPKLLSLQEQSSRPPSPLVERHKRKSSPARKAKASSPARKAVAPSPQPQAQPSIEIFDPPTPEIQRPTTKAKAEKKDKTKIDDDPNSYRAHSNPNKTTYGKSDKHSRHKSMIPKRVVDTTGASGSGSGIGKGSRRQENQQRQRSPIKPKNKTAVEATKAAAEEIRSPSPARVVSDLVESDIPVVKRAHVDLTDEN
ncbi:hypothetical protein B0T20DRAFT_400084 [Sordaria brevicollis]|uniref:Ubiquitin-like protease family profile domain-containing protein n=1 Tax=Sordaria brevicollis TaxID=83679 RepID=A0AAE0PNP8_SORBR|nr:hypothetical protein B0T20DRAFT_400084 [Sordaria brevicollis]